MSKAVNTDCLFVLNSLPDKQNRSLALDSALAAAALDRNVCILLTFDKAAEALKQAAESASSPLSLLRAADLFDIKQVAFVAKKAADKLDLKLPVSITSVETAKLSTFVGKFKQVFSYP